MFSQNWVCLVWKWLMDSVEIFSTLPDLPNSHIMKNPKKCSEKTFIYKIPYKLPINRFSGLIYPAHSLISADPLGSRGV